MSSFPPELRAAFGGPRHGLARACAGACGAGSARADLLGAQAAGPAAGSAGGAGAPISRAAASTTSRTITASPTRPIRRSRRASRRSRRRSRGARRRPATRATCRACPAISTRMRAQIALARDAGIDTVMVAPMIAGLVQFASAGARQSGHRLHRPSGAGGRRAHRAGAADRQAVPPARRRRRGVSQPWRPLRLFARDMPRARARRRSTTGTACEPSVPVPAGGMTPDAGRRDA